MSVGDVPLDGFQARVVRIDPYEYQVPAQLVGCPDEGTDPVALIKKLAEYVDTDEARGAGEQNGSHRPGWHADAVG